MIISENSMPGFLPVSAPGSAAQVCAWLLCLPFQLFHFSSSSQADGDYRSSLITASQILTLPKAPEKRLPQLARLSLPFPLPEKPTQAHNAPQTAAGSNSELFTTTASIIISQ